LDAEAEGVSVMDVLGSIETDCTVVTDDEAEIEAAGGVDDGVKEVDADFETEEVVEMELVDETELEGVAEREGDAEADGRDVIR